jgi:hypothetical protein
LQPGVVSSTTFVAHFNQHLPFLGLSLRRSGSFYFCILGIQPPCKEAQAKPWRDRSQPPDISRRCHTQGLSHSGHPSPATIWLQSHERHMWDPKEPYRRITVNTQNSKRS